MSHLSGLLLLHRLCLALMKSKSYSTVQHIPPGTKAFIRSGMWTDCVCMWSSSEEKLRTLDEYQENDQLMKASGYQATGKPRQRHLLSTRPWYLTALRLCVEVSSSSDDLSHCHPAHTLHLAFSLHSDTLWLLTTNWLFLCANITAEPSNYSNHVSNKTWNRTE